MREKGEELSGQYGDIIQHCFRSAHAHWFEKNRDELSVHRGRTRSNFVWDCVISNLRMALGQDGKFHFIDIHGTTLVIYDRSLLIKIKKLSRGLKASNVLTYASEKFNHQLDLGFELNLTNVYLGYVPNDINTEIDQIYIVCPDGDRIAWALPVLPQAPQQIIDFGNDGQVVDVPRRRIRVKNPSERSSSENGS